jgi:excisionase family DNA binding protein
MELPEGGWLTVEEVAAECRMSRSTVEKWIKSGVSINGRRVKLAATRIGSRYRITRESVAAFIAGCNPDATPLPETAAARKRRIAGEIAEARRLLAGG